MDCLYRLCGGAAIAACLAGAGGPRITAEQAVTAALNKLDPVAGGFTLHHPRYDASFRDDGVTFEPRRGRPLQWQITSIGGTPVPDASPQAARQDGRDVVTYARGPVVERFTLLGRSIRQSLVIREPPEGDTLSIQGRLRGASRGDALEITRRIEARDAADAKLPATLSVSGDSITLDVDGLDHAVFPVSMGPMIGPDTFRISDMGPDGDELYDAINPAIAFNRDDNEFLVVWEGDDNVGGLIVDEVEILGQLVDGVTGEEIGPDDFRISHMGPDLDKAYGAYEPSVVYNTVANEYLVIWRGNDGGPGLAPDEMEVYGQRLTPAGQAVGTTFRISAAGIDGDPASEVLRPRVVFNDAVDQYFVVWEGDAAGGADDGEYEIFGRRIDAAGNPIDLQDLRLSHMGPDGSIGYDAGHPDVAFDRNDGEYLVVWEGDDNTPPLVNGETEIFGQRIDSATGQEIGEDDFRISFMGADGDGNTDAFQPSVAFNSINGEYLVVWYADGDVGMADNEYEIFCQRIDAGTGTALGPGDRLSDMGPPGDPDFDAFFPDVAYDGVLNRYLVIWEADDLAGPIGNNEIEIYGRILDGVTATPLTGTLRFSDMGQMDGQDAFDAHVPVVGFGSVSGEYLVAWYGDDNTGQLTNEEMETYGQRVDGDGNEIGSDVRLSTAGVDGDLRYDAFEPVAAYNAVNHEFLVVWWGDDDVGSLVDDDFEVFGQRIDALTGEPVGPNDFRISDMGPDGDLTFTAVSPVVAHNPTTNEYLVVWAGIDDDGIQIDNDGKEIYGQRLDGATGDEIGENDFRISETGPSGDMQRAASTPAVACNPQANEFLVVWTADDDLNGQGVGEFEIYGQRLDGVTGAEVGTDDFRISDMGVDGDASSDGREPRLIYNPIVNEYLVAWRGDDQFEVANNETEIFGQRLDGDTCAELGENDFRISDMGRDGDPTADASEPHIAFNDRDNEYLVVWDGDDRGTLVDGESEIYGQRLDGVTGAEIGANDFRISDMGPDDDANYDAFKPKVAYHHGANEYLVVWQGDDGSGNLADNEYEIYGQRLASDGTEIGENDVRLSFAGVEGNSSSKAVTPTIAFAPGPNRYLVAWDADPEGSLAPDEHEIFGLIIEAPVACPADTNGDGVVGVVDFLMLLSLWGTDPGGTPDIDGNGVVDTVDLLALLAAWGPCP